jgi:hypothetical protein
LKRLVVVVFVGASNNEVMTMRLTILKSLALAAALSSTAATAQATVYTFVALLDGPSESPPVPTSGGGFANVSYNDAAHLLSVSATFTDLTGTTTASHIHCCTAAPGAGTAGVATQTPSFVGFPLGVTAGTFSNTYDLTLASSWNSAFIAANGGTTATAEAAFIAGLFAGEAYLNIHSSFRPGGEIRGFLAETPIPGALPLFVSGAGVLGFLGLRRRRRLPNV